MEQMSDTSYYTGEVLRAAARYWDEKDADSVKDIEITEVDIDNFIRAKGAIFSAIRTMLNSLDFTVDMIDDVYVAGGI